MQIPLRVSRSVHCWWAPALLATFMVVGCASATAPVADIATQAVPLELDHTQKFARWVFDFSTNARAAGVDDATLEMAFDNVRYVERVVALDRAQPEFSRSVWDYLDRAVSMQRVARGKDKLQQLRAAARADATVDLDAIATRYGVPAEVLVAIWGIESNYGSNMGDIPTIDALATLGFEGRREAWARGQLLAALKILQRRDIDRAQMVGSWAGAMGQTQFLPTAFNAYAVDADGDGRRDIWASVPDVMASTANFLARAGWQAGEVWAVEVRLPSGFDYARADAAMRQSTAQWALEGVQAMDGSPLPPLADSSLLLAAGARGPVFLVGPNFRAFLRYNNSTSYALAVSLLAQRLAGGSTVPTPQAPWPRDLQLLSRDQLLALQASLNARGLNCGTPDGTMGPATQRCVRQYQLSVGLPADGYPTLDLLNGP